MTNTRQKRLMQEALDEQLTPEAQAELRAHLERDAFSADTFDRLKQVDRTLRSAPHERAPKELAFRIMSQIAQLVKPQQLSRLSGLALALSLSLVALVMLPLLIGVGWLMLSIIGSAAALNTLIKQVVGLLALGISALEVFTRQLQTFLSANPEAPLVMAVLIPISLFWLLRLAPRSRAADTP